MKSRLRRPLLGLVAGASAFVLSITAASMTPGGANALRGLSGQLQGGLHSSGLLTDAMAGAGDGGPASMPSRGGGEPIMTVTVGASAHLSAKLLVSVPVSVTCPVLPAGGLQFGGISVQVLEAQGKQVVQGFGFTQLPAGACDGSAHTYIVGVLPVTSSSSSPSASSIFKVGQSVVLASAYGCDFAYDCASGSVGPQVLRIVH